MTAPTPLRIPLTRHHFYAQTVDGEPFPKDPDARYSVRLAARLSGGGNASVRLTTYQFDDTNPTEDPTSNEVAQLDFPLVGLSGDWTTLELPIKTSDLGATSTANMALLYVRLEAPNEGTTTLDVDDVAFVEWRPAPASLDRFGAYGFVHNDGPSEALLSVPGLALAR